MNEIAYKLPSYTCCLFSRISMLINISLKQTLKMNYSSLYLSNINGSLDRYWIGFKENKM